MKAAALFFGAQTGGFLTHIALTLVALTISTILGGAVLAGIGGQGVEYASFGFLFIGWVVSPILAGYVTASISRSRELNNGAVLALLVLGFALLLSHPVQQIFIYPGTMIYIQPAFAFIGVLLGKYHNHKRVPKHVPWT